MGTARVFRTMIRACVISALGVCLLPSLSIAQQYYDPGLLQRTIDRRPVDFESPGIRAGGFELHAGAELAWENNDNIFYFDGNFGISDDIIHARPWLNASSDWNRHALNFSFFADVASYSDFNSQNYTDWTASMDGRIDVRRGSAFNYGISHIKLHEDMRNPETQQSIEPVEFSIGSINLGYAHQFNRLTLAVGYLHDKYNYQNGKDGEGQPVNNQDRDRDRDTWSARLDYNFSDQTGMFFGYAGNSVDYDLEFDRTGVNRSSDGYDIRGGIAWNITGVITGDLFLQYINQDYDDPLLSDISGFGLGANLDWTPTRLTSLNFTFSNTPQDTTLRGASGYYSSLYSLRIQHELRRNLLLNARVSYTDNEYEYKYIIEPYDDPDGPPVEQQVLTGTTITRAGIGLSYLISRHFYLSGGYTYEKQDANISENRYTTNRFFITLGAEL
jgi:hypothetical protein